jgi:hypothetical protein
VLNRLRKYIAEDYRLKSIGYIGREYNYLKAFALALSLFGKEDSVIFENKARFDKAERRLKKKQMQELKSKGYNAKEVLEVLSVPLKTIYRWLKEGWISHKIQMNIGRAASTIILTDQTVYGRSISSKPKALRCLFNASFESKTFV